MKPEEFNWGLGLVTYWSLDFPDGPVEELCEKWELREDLAQVDYPHYVLDVGWLPESDPQGAYKVVAIYQEDWEAPVLKLRAKNHKQLRVAIQKVIREISALETTFGS